MNNIPTLNDLHIRITSSCNFNCQHCYAADWFNEKYELSIEDIKSLVDQAIELGCRKVTFSGGEPLFAQDITEAMGYCLDKNLKVAIETNGVLVDKIIDGLGEDRIRKVFFAISYDGNKMRDERFANLVKENIIKVANLGCEIKIQTAITKINIDEINDIFQFSKANGIKNRCFLAHSPSGNGKNIPSFEVEEWLTILKEVNENYPNVKIELPDIFPGRKKRKCGWGVHRCEVMPNGDVTSCAPITYNHREFIAGNIKKEMLKNIWANKHFTEIRKLKQSDFELPCSKCVYWKTCLGSCRSLAFSNGKKLLAPHPFCKALYDSIKNNEIDKSLLPDAELLEAWIKGIEDPNYVPTGDIYGDIVKKQHLEESK